MTEVVGRVLVVEDHQGVGRAWCRVLRRRGYLVDWARTVAGARRQLARADCSGEPFDVAIVDLHLPDGDGCTVLTDLELCAQQPAIAVVSAHIDSEVALELLGRCLIGVPKPLSAARLAQLVDRLCACRPSAGEVPALEPFCEACRLSPRETEVVVLSARGKSRSEIAAELGCEPNTVAAHWTRILRKTNLPTQRQVVSAAWSYGLRRLPIR